MLAGHADASWRLISAVAISATVFTTMQGLTYPLLALILDRAGVPEGLIGLNAAMMPLGMIMGAPLVPWAASRIGSYRLMIASILGAIACLLAIGATRDPWLWMVLRLLSGILLAWIFVVSETWINQLSSEGFRGRIVGLYAMLMSVGFALGPALLPLVGTEGWPPFFTGAACAAIALPPLVAVRRDLSRLATHERVSFVAFLSLAPVLLLCVAAVALADQGAMSLLPLYVLRHGFGSDAASLALVVMIAGSVTLQYPIGWLADRHDRRLLNMLCALAAALGSALLSVTVQVPWLFWVVVFIWGGSYYAIYVLALVRLGEGFSGSTLLAGNSAFGIMWGVGGIAGPPLIGGAMQLVGPEGLPATFATLFALLALTILASGGPTKSSKDGRVRRA